MSGTSLDGLDIAYVEIYQIQGEFFIENKFFKTFPYDNLLREKLLKNISPASANLREISQLNFDLADLFADNIFQFCEQFNLQLNDIDLIGSHGHTFYHQVEGARVLSTLQLGEPALIAAKTGITTVADFRPADVAAGGQGAPLVPFLDKVLFKNKNNIALQNIGGIANVSFIASGKITAFDNGPGNMLMNSMISFLSKGELNYDHDGLWAAKGRVNSIVSDYCFQHEYFSQQAPKTTGRELFGEQYSRQLYDKFSHLNLSNQDWLATLTFVVAKSIVQSYHDFLPVFPDEIVISGGGALNPVLMLMINENLPADTILSTIDDYGINSEAKEAVAFALLAYCTVFAIPNNLPKATGADHKILMGKICPGKNYHSTLLRKMAPDDAYSETTESNNLLSLNLDMLEPVEIVELMNKADYDVLKAVEMVSQEIATVMSLIIACLKNDGKLFYIGAGTSGRLAVLDASECPPTFKTVPELVQGIIAGGKQALTTSVEHAEDSAELGRNEIQNKMTDKDILIGISANGRAPFVLGALKEAYAMGAQTALITCNNLKKEPYIQQQIYLNVGPEVLSGSTRLKAGTATKMVLNMFTTGAFAKLGKVYGNYMVDLNVSNNKLKKRALNIISTISGVSQQKAEYLLSISKGSVKLALLVQMKAIEVKKAEELLAIYNGFLRKALNHQVI